MKVALDVFHFGTRVRLGGGRSIYYRGVVWLELVVLTFGTPSYSAKMADGVRYPFLSMFSLSVPAFV